MLAKFILTHASNEQNQELIQQIRRIIQQKSKFDLSFGVIGVRNIPQSIKKATVEITTCGVGNTIKMQSDKVQVNNGKSNSLAFFRIQRADDIKLPTHLILWPFVEIKLKYDKFFGGGLYSTVFPLIYYSNDGRQDQKEKALQQIFQNTNKKPQLIQAQDMHWLNKQKNRKKMTKKGSLSQIQSEYDQQQQSQSSEDFVQEDIQDDQIQKQEQEYEDEQGLGDQKIKRIFNPSIVKHADTETQSSEQDDWKIERGKQLEGRLQNQRKKGYIMNDQDQDEYNQNNNNHRELTIMAQGLQNQEARDHTIIEMNKLTGTYNSLGLHNFEQDDDDFQMTGVDQVFINFDKMINTNCTRDDKQKILEENKIKLQGLEEEKKLVKKNKKFNKDQKLEELNRINKRIKFYDDHEIDQNLFIGRGGGDLQGLAFNMYEG